MNYTYEPVTDVAQLDAAIARVRAAQKIFATYSQEQVDKIFLAAATAANRARIPLAKLAVEETEQSLGATAVALGKGLYCRV